MLFVQFFYNLRFWFITYKRVDIGCIGTPENLILNSVIYWNKTKNASSLLFFFSYFVLFIKIINKENVTQIYGVKSQYIHKYY